MQFFARQHNARTRATFFVAFDQVRAVWPLHVLILLLFKKVLAVCWGLQGLPLFVSSALRAVRALVQRVLCAPQRLLGCNLATNESLQIIAAPFEPVGLFLLRLLPSLVVVAVRLMKPGTA